MASRGVIAWSRIAQFAGACVPVNSSQLSKTRSSILTPVKVLTIT